MVFGFVKQSGGHIRIYSEVGQGTSVKLYLPRLMTETEPMPEDAQPAAPPRAASGCTVLVVEDEDGVREFVVRTLRELGYATREAADSAAALAILGESGQTLDLLLTDVGLPGMNGRALADQARTMRQELKVLFMTGYTRNAIVHGGRLDPGVIVLPKPFTAAVLGRRVNDALAARPAAPVATAAEGC
jgi:CheY-like chemotaxis protein